MTGQTLRLADRRAMAFEETGDAAGAPIFLAHGLAGSRLEARVVAAAAMRGRCPPRLPRQARFRRVRPSARPGARRLAGRCGGPG